MSTDAARTKLRELIATKQQWLRQWQAPELLSPGRSDMIQVLSDNIAELQQVLAELDKAEPQEPDSPERRCGGPGCDMRCCQPVQEPQGCAHCNHPLYAATKCRVCGRVTEPVQEPVAWMYTGIKQDGTTHGPHLVWKPAYMDAMSASKGAQATPLYTAPPQRLPLTSDKDRPDQGATYVEGYGYVNTRAVRAVERAHGIGGEG